MRVKLGFALHRYSRGVPWCTKEKGQVTSSHAVLGEDKIRILRRNTSSDKGHYSSKFHNIRMIHINNDIPLKISRPSRNLRRASKTYAGDEMWCSGKLHLSSISTTTRWGFNNAQTKHCTIPWKSGNPKDLSRQWYVSVISWFRSVINQAVVYCCLLSSAWIKALRDA